MQFNLLLPAINNQWLLTMVIHKTPMLLIKKSPTFENDKKLEQRFFSHMILGIFETPLVSVTDTSNKFFMFFFIYKKNVKRPLTVFCFQFF